MVSYPARPYPCARSGRDLGREVGPDLREVTGQHVPRRGPVRRLQHRLRGGADVLGLPAARPEPAAARRVRSGCGTSPTSRIRSFGGTPRTTPRSGGGRQQRLGVGVLRRRCRSARAVPCSTILPRYITATRSQKWRTTPRSWAMKMKARPSSWRRSSSRFITWAWMETSSAETGSSATISFGLHRQRPGDADALALTAGELVRVAVVVLGVQADQLEQLLRPAAAPGPSDQSCTRSGVATIVPTVCRGFSEAVRVLEDDLQLAAERAQLPARAGGRCRCPRTGSCPTVGSSRRVTSRAGGRLAAAGLADQAEGLAAGAR